MDLSIVILSYNTKELLENCLDSVAANIADLQAEVFVVDSSSTDGSIELVRARYPWVKLIVTPDFRGFAHANNLALRQASGAYQLVLNSDTVLPPGGLRAAIAFMKAHPKAGALGVKLVKADGSLDLACRRSFPTPAVSFYKLSGLSALFPRSPRLARYNLTFLDPDQTTEVDSVCCAFMLIRREAIEQVGLLDESFYFYGEDIDWAFRLKQQGWAVYYYPGVQVLHYKGQSSRKQSDRLLHEFYQAMRTFYRKHYAAQNPRPLRWLVYLAIALGEAWARFKNHLRPPAARRVSA